MDASLEGEYLWHLFAKMTFSHESQFEIILRELPVHTYGRILDLGCGAGSLIRFLLSRGYACEGIDANATRIDLACKLTKPFEGCRFTACRALDYLSQHPFDAAIWTNVPLDLSTLLTEFLDCATRNVRIGGRILFDYLTIDNNHSHLSSVPAMEWKDQLNHCGDDMLEGGSYQRIVRIDYRSTPWKVHWACERIGNGRFEKVFQCQADLPSVDSHLLRAEFCERGWRHIKEISTGPIEIEGIPTGLGFVMDLFERIK